MATGRVKSASTASFKRADVFAACQQMGRQTGDADQFAEGRRWFRELAYQRFKIRGIIGVVAEIVYVQKDHFLGTQFHAIEPAAIGSLPIQPQYGRDWFAEGDRVLPLRPAPIRDDGFRSQHKEEPIAGVDGIASSCGNGNPRLGMSSRSNQTMKPRTFRSS